MAKNIYQIYLLLVCFFSIVVMTISLAVTLIDVTEMTLPEYAKYSSLRVYQTDESYKTHLSSFEPKKPIPSNLTEARLAAKADQIEEIRGNAIQGIFNTLVWLMLSSGLFLLHWKLFQKEKKDIPLKVK